MLATRNPNYPGVRIKALRLALGITTRGWKTIAGASLASAGISFPDSPQLLSEMEKPEPNRQASTDFQPVCDYRLSFRELLEIYGLDLNEITRLQMEIQLPQTH